MNNEDRETPVPTPDDSQKVVEQKTLAVATAVQDLVDPVKQVLKKTNSVMNLARVSIALSLILLAGLSVALWRQNENAIANGKNADAIAKIVEKSNQTAQDVADVKAGVDEIPRIDVQPADTSDPTSKPVAILRPGKTRRAPSPSANGDAKRPPPPPGIEIEVDVTHHKAHPKKKK